MTKLMLVALDSDKELRVKVDVLDYSMGGVFFFFLKIIGLLHGGWRQAVVSTQYLLK